MDVLRYDSYNVLVANCAPANRRMPFNLTANTTYRNANGYLACGQQPFPTMYNVFTACWGLVALGLLLRVARDSDSSVQQEYTTKNELVVVVLSIPLLFGVHGQTASAGYRLSDKVGLLDPPPFWWLRPVLYVARDSDVWYCAGPGHGVACGTARALQGPCFHNLFVAPPHTRTLQRTCDFCCDCCNRRVGR